MKKHQLHTTLSQKHWELLRKLSEKYDTQQKALELALEKLADGSDNATPMTPEVEFLMRIGNEVKMACMVPRENLKELMRTVDVDGYAAVLRSQEPIVYAMEYLMQKNIKDCSQKDIIDNFILNARVANWFDMINYTDDGAYYTLHFYHTLGLNCSKISREICESMFNSCGYRVEYDVTERYLFARVYKK